MGSWLNHGQAGDNMDAQRGNTAEVSDYDAEKVCKLFYPGIPYEYVQQEYENAKKLIELGVRVPKAFEIIDRDGRYGIIYEKIHGKPMREYMDRESMFERFITEHKKLLSISTDALIPYQDILITMIRGRGNRESAEDFREEIQSLPNGNTLLHGDYHPGNIMIAEDEEFVIIDLLNVCHGPKEYDVARTFFLLENEQWRKLYLAGMGYCQEEIEGYLEIVRKIRKYE